MESSIYVKFVERGTLLTAGHARVVFIGSAANGVPQCAIESFGGFYLASHNNGSVGVTSTLAVAPAIGDTVELLLNLFGDGSVQITQSINSAASTSSVQSAANALSTAWSAQLLWLNSTGSSFVGLNAFQSAKVVAGARSLVEMRAP